MSEPPYGPGCQADLMAVRGRTPPADPGSLIAAETVAQPAAGSGARRRHVLRTSDIELQSHRENDRLFAEAKDLRAVVLKSPEAPSVALLKRGIEGRVEDRPLRIHRPRYGLRRRDRTIVIEGDG